MTCPRCADLTTQLAAAVKACDEQRARADGLVEQLRAAEERADDAKKLARSYKSQAREVLKDVRGSLSKRLRRIDATLRSMGPAKETIECRACNGDGVIDEPAGWPPTEVIRVSCMPCKGTGRVAPTTPAPVATTPLPGAEENDR